MWPFKKKERIVPLDVSESRIQELRKFLEDYRAGVGRFEYSLGDCFCVHVGVGGGELYWHSPTAVRSSGAITSFKNFEQLEAYLRKAKVLFDERALLRQASSRMAEKELASAITRFLKSEG